MQNPAADVAGAVAAALAMSAKVSLEHNGGDNGDAERWLMLADRAFQYAKRMTNVHGDNGTCTKSTAVDNCIGRGCEELDEFGDPVRGVRAQNFPNFHPKPPNPINRAYRVIATRASCSLIGIVSLFS